MQYQQIDASSELALESGDVVVAAPTPARRSENGRRLMTFAMTLSVAVSVCALLVLSTVRVGSQVSAIDGLMQKNDVLGDLGDELAESESLINHTENATEEEANHNDTFERYDEQKDNASKDQDLHDDLPHDEEDHIKEAFAHLDLDGNGSATLDELVSVFNTSAGFSLEGLQSELAAIDLDHNGCLEYVEFLELMLPKEHEHDQEHHQRSAFNSLDGDADGGIDKPEIKAWALRFTDSITDEEVEGFLNHTDTDHSRKIEFPEFQAVM